MNAACLRRDGVIAASLTPAGRWLFAVFAAWALPAGAQPRPIVIGQTVVHSGPLAELSAAPEQGIRALLHQVNAAGGLRGRPLLLKQLDDGYDAARAAANVQQLARDGAVAILMPIGTASSEGALQAANAVGLPLVGPYSGAASLRNFTAQGFQVRVSFDDEYRRIVQHLMTIGLRRIAFAHNDNPGARSARDGTRRSIEALGGKLLGSVAVRNDASDAGEQARRLAALAPQVVVLSMSNAVAAAFIAAYRATAAPAQFYSFSFLDGRALHQRIAGAATGVVISQVVPYPWNAGLPLVAEYQSAMRQLGSSDVGYGSLEGYINAKVLVEGLRRAGPELTPAALKAALEGLRAFDLGGITLDYGPTRHNGLGFSELTMIRSDGGHAK